MDLMNAKQTAKMLGITYSQFWRILGKGQFHPPYVMIGAKKRFIRSEVERWLLESQVTSPAAAVTAALTTAPAHEQ